jgi:hypothetical protein
MEKQVTKTCKNCNQEKELGLFFKDVRYKNGVKSNCKDCYVVLRQPKTREYFIRNKQRIYAKHKEYRETSKEQNSIKHKEWIKNNKDKIRLSDRVYSKNRKRVDLNYKLKCNIRSKISYELKNNIKRKSTVDLLGCTVDKLRAHLESKFKEGMTWNNYGEWHIDHIKPCSMFDFSNKEHQVDCFHYTNLQPLWAKENIIKSNKI